MCLLWFRAACQPWIVWEMTQNMHLIHFSVQNFVLTFYTCTCNLRNIHVQHMLTFYIPNNLSYYWRHFFFNVCALTGKLHFLSLMPIQFGFHNLDTTHTAFAALTHRLSSKWSYLYSCLLNYTRNQQTAASNWSNSEITPSLIRRLCRCNDLEYELFTLPASLGGFGIEFLWKSREGFLVSLNMICTKPSMYKYYLRTKLWNVNCPVN